MNQLVNILKQYWGFSSFRPLQREVIQSILDGSDTLALMPTGGGKSLCYQVPALAMDGLCLVISPLIALMKDQVEGLRKKNITAFAIYSGMSRKETINTFKVASNSNCKFLFVSPERLETNLFKEYLPGLGINLIAVDEAHCISQWGYDFRPPYLRISKLREELPGVPVLALTASATREVQKDICEKLTFQNKGKPDFAQNEWKIFRQSFERANLSYSVFKIDSKINKIIEIVQKVNGTGIIYCKSRKRTKEISDLLQYQKIQADYYHAGLSQEERSRKQEAWMKGSIRVIVCTNAFGMGIDKPDVRTVIHADVPDCLESYYQEAGRAGRDGKKSYAVLLYDDHGLHELEELLAVRFPAIEEIRRIYQAVVNYLQIPSGTGEGNYYDFELGDFVKKFNFTSFQVLYSLKALEQDGWMIFNEQVFRQAMVGFTTNKDNLYRFEQTHIPLEPIIKALLRSYEGIFDIVVPISEKMLVVLVQLELEEIKKQLNQLAQAGIIDYEPQKDIPQVYFPRPRIKAEDVTIDMRAYKKRKEEHLQRIKKMTAYVLDRKNCRSEIIGNYFGDEQMRTCGICDNCLAEKAMAISKEEFTTIANEIDKMLENTVVSTSDLISRLSKFNKSKAWRVIEFLQAEEKIVTDITGRVTKREKTT